MRRIKKYKSNVLTLRLLRTLPTYLFANSTTLILVFVDGIVSGNFIGPDALVGISIASPNLFICGAFVAIVSRGSQVPLSKALGKMDDKAEASICRTAVVMSIFLMVLFIFLQSFLLILATLGYPTDSPVKKACYAYTSGFFIANIVGVISTVGLYILIAYGKSKVILRMAIVEVCVNSVFDVLFVCFFNLGVFGAGLGTSVANVTRMILTLYYLQKEVQFFSIIRTKVSFQFLTVIKFGIPPFLFTVLPQFMIMIINYLILVALGQEGMLAKSLGSYALQIALIIANSIIASMGPVLGLSKGTNDLIGEKKVFRLSLLMVTVFTAALTVLLCLCPQILFLIFGAHSASDHTLFLFRIFALSCVTSSIFAVFSNYLIYCDKKLFVSVLSCFDSVIILPSLIVIITKINPDYLFLSYTISGAIKIAIYYVMYLRFSNNNHSQKILYAGFHDTSSKANDSEKYLDKLECILGEFKFNNLFIKQSRLLAEEVIFFNRFLNEKVLYYNRFGLVIFKNEILFYCIDNGEKWEENLEDENQKEYITNNYLIAKKFSDDFKYKYVDDLNYFSFSKKYSVQDTSYSEEEFSKRKRVVFKYKIS